MIKPTSIVIVGGSRGFDDFDLLRKTLDDATFMLKQPIFAHGCADGADTLAERWMDARKVPYFRYPIHERDWKKHGKQAGPIRNTEMVEDAKKWLPNAFAIVFWDGESDGSYDLIKKCKKAGIKTKVVLYKELADESSRKVQAPKSGRRDRPARSR